MKSTKFFEGFAQAITLGIHTTAPARVTKFDSVRHRATVKILFKTKSTSGSLSEYTVIEDAPVLKHCIEDIKVGSCVFVSFAERALDNLNGNKEFDPDSVRLHDISDAVVMGVFEG